MNVYVDCILQSEVHLPKNQYFVNRIHNRDCWTLGLHSNAGNILKFNFSLTKGSHEILLSTENISASHFVDIDHFEVPKYSEEITKEINSKKGLTKGQQIGISIGVIIVVAVIVIICAIVIICKKKKSKSSIDVDIVD